MSETMNNQKPAQELEQELINLDEATDLNLDEDENKKRRFQAYVIIFGAIFVLVILIIFAITKLSVNDEVEKVEEKTNSRIVKKDFKAERLAIKKEEEKNLQFEQLFSSNPSSANDNIQLDNQVEAIPFKKFELKPQLVKGTGGALISSSNISTIKEDTSLNDVIENQSLESDLDYQGDVFRPTKAKVMKINPSLLLAKGSYIGCSLNTRFISDIKGGLSCTISNDVYSSDGKVLLLEKGSKMFGTYKSGQMNDGLNRIFAIWQEIRTPNNLIIPIYSGASDELGGAGLEGEVDHKWFLRFGSAVLLSAIDDIFNVLAYNLNGKKSNEDNSIDYTENTRENAKDMASVVLEQFIKIKPTLYKNHGDLVGVYVNRDIDFSSVYNLKKR